MDSRSRVLAALTGEEPDRVPVALGFSGPELSTLAPPGRLPDTEWTSALSASDRARHRLSSRNT